jgi:hypothetical protein
MAERRMFAKTIIDSDAFLDMPMSAQALYFHLSMRADDDGFINNPRRIQRMIGANDDDLKILIAKSFVILFESGVVVIKHWKIHNYIQSDRYKPTVYREEKELLSEKNNKAYSLDTECIQDGYNLDTQVRLGKDSIGKDNSVGEKRKRFTPPTLEEVQAYVKERKSTVDPQRFFEYYETGGWKDSKGQSVKNWKQKLITWEKKETSPEKKGAFNKYPQPEVDYAELEKKIYAN